MTELTEKSGTRPTARRTKEGAVSIVFQKSRGLDVFVDQVAHATPYQIVNLERTGVEGVLIRILAKRLDIPSTRLVSVLGIAKSSAARKIASGGTIKASSGQAAIGMVKLLGIAKEIVAQSTAPEAVHFDAAKWLGRWIERPQPSLGGVKPADLLDTPTGVELVARLLRSIGSGAYQ